MFLRPVNVDSETLGLMVFVVIPVIYLLCWLYNAHRMGKFRKKQRSASDVFREPTYKTSFFVLSCIAFGVLLVQGLRVFF